MFKVSAIACALLIGSANLVYAQTAPSALDLEGYTLESATVGHFDADGRRNHSTYDIFTLPGPGHTDAKYGDLKNRNILVDVKFRLRSPDLHTVKLVIVPAMINFKYEGITARATWETVSMSLKFVAGQPISAINGTYVGGSVVAAAGFSAGYKFLKNTKNSVSIQNFSLGQGFGVDVSKVTANLKIYETGWTEIHVYKEKVSDETYRGFEVVEIQKVLNHVL